MADRQHGVLARQQLLEAGFGVGAIEHRIAIGRLFKVHRGIYAVGRRALTREGHWMAAVLAAGPDSFLSHRTAAALHQLRPSSSAKIDVSVAADHRQNRATIRFHSTILHPEDITTVDRIPATSIARTILDLAGVLNKDQLLRVIEGAERAQKFDLRSLERAMARRLRARGINTLRAILADYREAPPTRSKLERDFLALIDRLGLPRPQVNTIVAGFEVDIFWPQYNLVVELDGLGYHRSPRAFEADRLKDAALQRHGFRVLRITRKRLEDDPEGVIRDLIALISLAAA